MDDFTTAYRELDHLTAALQLAVTAGDVQTVTRIIQGRGPLIARCLAFCQELAGEQRTEAAQRLYALLAMDDSIIVATQQWLAQTRAQLLQLQRGTLTLERYRAPLATVQHYH